MLRLFLIFATCIFCLQAYATEYAYNITSGVRVGWNTADKVGIFPVGSTQSRFDVSSIDNNDNHTATLDGHGKSLKVGIRYLALYPYNYSYYENDDVSTSLPISFPTLTQTANGTLSHIAQSDYMAADITATSQSLCTLNFDHLNALLRMSVMVPKDATFRSMTIHSAKASFITSGTLNLATRVLTTKTSSADMVLNIDNVLVKRGETLTTYCIVPVADLSGQTLTATFETTTGEQYTCSFQGQQMQAGKIYNIERTLNKANSAKSSAYPLSPTKGNDSPNVEQHAAARALAVVKGVVSDFTLAYSDISYDPLPPDYILGDANIDGYVNVGDITAVANHILKRTPAKFDAQAADANTDGNINVGDITKIANIILKGK